MGDSSSDESETEPFRSSSRRANTAKLDLSSTRSKFASMRLVSDITTVKDFSGASDSALSVEPREVRFESIKPGALYVMTISVRNRTDTPQRIRIQPPKSSWFALNYIPMGSVAPGLDVRAEIECQLPDKASEFSFGDSITAIMGAYRIEIPLFASKVGAIIGFQKFLDFGHVVENQKVSSEVVFENVGEAFGVVDFKLVDNSCLRVTPQRFDLPPSTAGSNRRTVKFELDAKTTGSWREVVGVKVTGGVATHSVLDLSAQIVRPMLTLLADNNGGIVDSIEFGSLLYGQETTKTAYLFNGSPNPLSFTILYGDEEDVRAPISTPGNTNLPQTDEATQAEKSIVISPTDGIIKPYSQVPIRMIFRPEMPSVQKGFAKQFRADMRDALPISRKASIDGIETGQRISFFLRGLAALPSVSVNPSILRFGSCPVNDRRDVIVQLVNNTSSETTYKFPKVPHFTMTPSKGKLLPLQTKSAIVTFQPSQLGKFKTVARLVVADGLSGTDVKLVAETDGTSVKKILIGGNDKCPEDFATSCKFVDPAKVLAERLDAEYKKTLSLSKAGDDDVASLRSNDRDSIYATGTRKGGDTSSVRLTPDHPFSTRRLNDARYNDYLKQSRENREQSEETRTVRRQLDRGAPNRADFFAPDMGMERGLDEPGLKLPPATDPLWLADRGKGSRNRAVVDENRLILKKYSASPCSQAEMRDCSLELSSEDLKNVYASHKIINFGVVCITSVIAKNFVITNERPHSVHVHLEDVDQELKQSKPDAQVIPAGAFAGFDIYFTSRTLGKFKKTFTWITNKIHSNKVTVLAEVVPIELVLSKKSLTMEFANDSLEAHVSQDVQLTNPGNAIAEFLWGSAGAFECKPERGVVNPGQTVTTTIVWTPMPGKRNDEELGLHISNGIDLTLKVEGLLQESKAQFDDKRLMVGTVAVGAEKVYQTKLRNIGAYPAVFFMDDADADTAAGFSVSPLRGIIPPGQDTVIEVTVSPRAPMTFDTILISATIRGGKNVCLKASGQSIIPQLVLDEKSFDFGEVTIGNEYALPFTLTNNSSIDAELQLDLSSHLDFFPHVTREWASDADEDRVSTNQEDGSGNIVELLSNQAQKTKSGGGVDTERNAARGGKEQPEQNIWRFILAANSTMNGILIFKPSAPASYSFDLPLFMQGIRDNRSFAVPVRAHAVESRLLISMRLLNFGDRVVARDPMSRSTYCQEISFKNLDKSSPLSYEIRDTVAQVDTQQILPVDKSAKQAADKKNQAMDLAPPPSVFFVSPMKGTIPPGAACAIFVTFLPQESGDFRKRLDVFVNNQTDPARPYLALTAKGSGVYPRLSFNKHQVDLPPVPLGITSSSSFVVRNEGYGALELKYRVSPTVPIPLLLSFPDGPDVGLTMEKVRVVVTASSDVPLSFAGKIEFYDTDGERFTIPVTGCFDCCLLTNYPFVRAFSDVFGFIGLDNQPVKFLSKMEVVELKNLETKRRELIRRQKSLERQQQLAPQGKSSQKAQPGADIKQELQALSAAENQPSFHHIELDFEKTNMDWRAWSYIEGEAVVILKWLNKFVCRKPFDVDRFPECIFETYGDLLVDCIEQMSGQRIKDIKPGCGEGCDGQSSTAKRGPANGNVPAAAHTPKPQTESLNSQQHMRLATAVRLGSKYRVLLNWLLRAGAMLNHVNPLDLLGFDDHMMAQEVELKKLEGTRLTPSMLAERKQWWASGWQIANRFSWMEVLLQCVKVFVLSRVTYSYYSKMPGVVLIREVQSMESPDAVDQKDSGSKKKKKKLPANYPPEYGPSNIIGQAESVLLAWVSYHIQRAANLTDDGAGDVQPESRVLGLSNRMVDIESDLFDLRGFCQVIHAHLPEMTKTGAPLCGYTTLEKNRDEMFPKVDEALNRIRLSFNVDANDITRSGRTLLLLIMHLFLNLPSLIPKATIEFRGLLGAPITKMIELSNPSKKKVGYTISIEGSADFSLPAKELILPPESSLEFPVTLKASFSSTACATVTFWGVRDGSGGMAGATMVFLLRSSIIGRIPIETIRHSLGLFEYEVLNISVKNPFDRDCSFAVKLAIQHIPQTVDQALKNTSSGVPKKRASPDQSYAPITEDSLVVSSAASVDSAKSHEEFDFESFYKRPVWCTDDVIDLGAGESHTLNLNILPFMLGTYSCQVILQDPSVGEICYLAIVDVNVPKAFEKLEFSETVKNGECVTKALRIASRNVAFEKAVATATDLRLTAAPTKTKARGYLMSLLASPIAIEELGISKFLISVVSPYFSCQKDLPFISEYVPAAGGGVLTPNNLPPPPQGRGKKVAKSSIDPPSPSDLVVGPSNPNLSLLTFSPEKPGTYIAKAIVYSKDNSMDIRTIDIVSSVAMPESRITIQFKGPARQKLVQEIPIQNDSNADWQLSVNVTGNGFSGPKSLLVPHGGKANVFIVFVGPYMGSFEGTLILRNSSDGDSFEYSLRGVAEDPLAEGHLVFKCKAKDGQKFSIPLRQIERPPRHAEKSEKTDHSERSGKKGDGRLENQRFTIETDLPYMVGSAQVEVPPSGCNYEFGTSCPSGGLLSGSVTFTEVETGLIQWYTVEIDVSSPLPESVIDIDAIVRRAVAVEIVLENPTTETLSFNVLIDGPGLLGDKVFTLPPGEDRGTKYELIYSPLYPGNFKGRISFSNEKVGEIWYSLSLNAMPAPATILDLIECMIGSSTFIEVPIENPLPDEVCLDVEVSDPEHFQVLPEVLKLAPYSQSSFELHFRPSSLSEIVRTDILISNQLFGEVRYEASGSGMLPGMMPTVQLFSPLGEIGSHSIVFRNPFNHPLPIDVILTHAEKAPGRKSTGAGTRSMDMDDSGRTAAATQAKAFALLMRKSSDIIVGPRSPQQLSISFSPDKLGEYNAVVEVRSNVGGRNLLWCYPLVGMAESGKVQKLQRLVTPCKASITKDIDICLEGLDLDTLISDNLSIEDFTFELILDPKVEAILGRSLRILPLELKQPLQEGLGNISIRYRVLFEPLRLFQTTVEVLVTCSSRGRWKASMELEVTEPLPDDVINLTAAVGSTDKVSFRLSNRFLGYSSFQAYFGPKSSPHFSVAPTTGVLAPYGSDGTPFIVTFAPTEYQSREVANLVIATDEAQWTYEVIGCYPEHMSYVSQVKSKIDAKRS